MLRKRSRGLSSSQGLMSDHHHPTPSCNSPRASSPFMSPRPFEAAMSPTSILEGKALANSSSFVKAPRKAMLEYTVAETRQPQQQQHPWDNGGESRAIGLGIVDALKNEPINKKSLKHDSRMVLFGSQLRIHIPSTGIPAGATESPRCAVEFGVKTRSSQLALLSPIWRSSFGNLGSEGMGSPSPRVVTGQLSKTELELSRSEDYTCVIMHGPNPRTTHIFDTCSDAECCSNGGRGSHDVLSFCHACKKSLEQGRDIFMCRGEKAFCSVECQCQKMFLDQEAEECSPEPPLSP